MLSSDAISSVAYATEQTLLVLAILGWAALDYVIPISAVIVGLLASCAMIFPTGDAEGRQVTDLQPTKLAAMEGLVARIAAELAARITTGGAWPDGSVERGMRWDPYPPDDS